MIDLLKLLFVLFTRNPFFYIPMSLGILYAIGIETGLISPEAREFFRINHGRP